MHYYFICLCRRNICKQKYSSFSQIENPIQTTHSLCIKIQIMSKAIRNSNDQYLFVFFFAEICLHCTFTKLIFLTFIESLFLSYAGYEWKIWIEGVNQDLFVLKCLKEKRKKERNNIDVKVNWNICIEMRSHSLCKQNRNISTFSRNGTIRMSFLYCAWERTKITPQNQDH